MKILFLLYFVTLGLFSVLSFLFIDKNLSYLSFLYTGISTNQRIITTVAYTTLVICAYVLFALLIKHFRLHTNKISDIKFLIIGSTVILFFAYPAILSYDIFNYLTSAKVLFYYHENPYVIMPIEFMREPYLSFTRAANKTVLYGPVWVLASGIPYILGFNNFIMILLEFKILTIAFYILTLYMIYKLSASRFAVFVFALNPLVLIETLVSVHNDIIMMGLALLSLFLLRKKRVFLSFCILLCSVLIKYATIFLLPVFMFVIIQDVLRKKIIWEKVYFWSFLIMLGIFLFSFLREEIYPWYAIWFLVFYVLWDKNGKFFQPLFLFSLSLSLTYIPYMSSGNYFGQTPILKMIILFVPICAYGAVGFFRKRYA